jgi:hypothetical protein
MLLTYSLKFLKRSLSESDVFTDVTKGGSAPLREVIKGESESLIDGFQRVSPGLLDNTIVLFVTELNLFKPLWLRIVEHALRRSRKI